MARALRVVIFTCVSVGFFHFPRLAAHAHDGQATKGALAVTIRKIVDAERVPLLHHPDFADHQATIRQVYAALEYEPLWLRDGRPTSQARQTIGALLAAEGRGLNPADYDAATLQKELALADSRAPRSELDWATFDTALTVAVVRYVSDAHFGRVPPSAVGLSLEPTEASRFELVPFVLRLPDADDPLPLLATLDPRFALFGPLMTALAHWRALAARRDVPRVPDLPKLRPGESHPGVKGLRDFLRIVGDVPPRLPGSKNASLYDSDLVKAVKRFQQRHALSVDGVIGPATMRQLRVPPAARVRQIELALERLRWLPPPDEDAFVIVNLPEYRLRAYYRGSDIPALQLNAVVGSASLRHETPVLRATMQYLVFRPYWDVPPTIAQKEILPAAERDPSYFAKHRYEFHHGRIRQLPGGENALGLLKFVFPNRYHVYMHDTPSKRLFARDRRDFSHGCIRVSDAAALAEFVLRGQGKWDRDRIDAALSGNTDNHRVYLKRPVGVYLLYSTVVADPDGTTYFFDDIYGYDARLDAVLTKGPPYPNPTRTPTPRPTATAAPVGTGIETP